MSHFEKNIAALHRRNPPLAECLEAVTPGGDLHLGEARNGEPTARSGEVWLHSPYNPTREAQEWARAQAERFTPDAPLTVVGFGLGHHLRELATLGFGGTVIEKSLALLKAALEASDLVPVLERFELMAGIPADLIRRRHNHLLRGNTTAHPATVRISPDMATLAQYADGYDPAARGGLKILLVNPIYGGSLPAAHHAARALRALGHQVIPFESERLAAAMDFGKEFIFNQSRRAFHAGLTSLLSQAVELRARETRPDMILALAQAPLLPETMKRIEARGIPTAFWFVEDYRVLPYWRDSAPAASYFFGIQTDNFAAELARAGVTRYAYLPTCAEPSVHRPMELTPAEREEFGSPLSFVGAGYYNRQIFFKGLTDFPFRIWGSDWPFPSPLVPFIQRGGARIDTETTVKIFNASAVNLNLHSSTTCDGVVPDGDFVNPRTFELAACGAFQLVDRRALLPELFDEGELETFGCLDEAREKISRFLADPEERRQVAGRGMARVLAEHTYEHRMAELVALMTGTFPHLAERIRQRADQRDEIMADLDRHAGLAGLLATLPDQRWFTLNDVLGTIVTGQGKLSRAEKLFLMLQNVEVLWEKIPE